MYARNYFPLEDKKEWIYDFFFSKLLVDIFCRNKYFNTMWTSYNKYFYKFLYMH